MKQNEDKEDKRGVLDPNELEIGDDEHVEEISENRYVVSPNGTPTVPEDTSSDDDMTNTTGSGEIDSETVEGRPLRSPGRARSVLQSELEISNGAYGVDIVGKFDGDTAQHRSVSSDVIKTFEDIVRWYAQNVTDGTPTDEVVNILLDRSSFQPDETESLKTLLNDFNLNGEDSINDLAKAIRDREN